MANGKGAGRDREWQILEALAFQIHSCALPELTPFAIPNGNWSWNGKREWQMQWNGSGNGSRNGKWEWQTRKAPDDREWQTLEVLAFQTHSWPLPGVIPFAIPDGN